MRFLIVITVILATVIGVLVTGLIAYAVIRYRDRGDGAEPAQTGRKRNVEIAYTVIPLGIQCGLFFLTVMTMHRAEPQEADRAPDLVIVAHQWWWEIRYPSAAVVSANEIHLPAGRQIWAELRSADVIHELWVPQLGPKMDTVPGKPNRLMLQADQVGEYLGDCAEYCGPGHAWMRLRVVVQSPTDFAAWEKQQAQPAAAITAPFAHGREIFQTQTCIQCHTITGVSNIGKVGPDLTHFGSRATLGAGVADNTAVQLQSWLENPQLLKPGCYMPQMRLQPADVQDLTAYLEALK